MPIYEYACTSCGRHYEVKQAFSDAPLETCEVCQGTLKRVFHPVGIVLKGSGFYATDNRSGKALKPTKDATSSDKPASGGGSAAGKTESSGSTEKKADTKSTPPSEKKSS